MHVIRKINTTSKEHLFKKLLNGTVPFSKIVDEFSFCIKQVNMARNGLPPPVPKTQFVCITEVFSVIVDTMVFLAVTAEDGGIARFPCPFSTLVLCLQFPLSCMIISSTSLCVTATIPSLSLSFPFLLFLVTRLHLHSPTFSHVIKPWVLRYSSSSHALCGFTDLLLRVRATLRAQKVTTQ